MYGFLIRCYGALLALAARFHPKARLWHVGRRNWRARYREAFPPDPARPVLWMHAASLGEFEQGRPVLEAWRARHPEYRIVLSFFSPSGYEIRKHYNGADFVCYLPLDTARNARDFVDIIQPAVAIFVKYEFWHNYLKVLKTSNIKTLLISSVFRPEQAFFKPWGAFWRKMLSAFTHIYVQDARSVQLLQSINNIQAVTRAGDTRIDRVLDNAQQAHALPEGVALQADLVVGSSWPADEALLLPLLAKHGWRAIIAPHEPAEAHLQALEKGLPASSSVRLSKLHAGNAHLPYVLVDGIGQLNRLYRYGRVAYIGGGFGKGIHNTLEPAAYGLPVVFGPKYQKFEEAKQLSVLGGFFPVQDGAALEQHLKTLLGPGDAHAKAAAIVLQWLEENKGATEQVLNGIKAQDG